MLALCVLGFVVSVPSAPVGRGVGKVHNSDTHLDWWGFDEHLAVQHGAVCNDGTVGGVYFRKGDLNNTLVYFEGGWACYDKGTCADRNRTANALMSSNTWDRSGKSLGGMFSSDSPLYRWNLVYVPYCTSDSWTGDSNSPTDDIPYVFRGSRVVDYIRYVHLGSLLNESSIVVLSGCSAGGRGSLYNLDRFCSNFQNDQRCIGVHDAAWWNDLTPFDVSKVSLKQAVTQGVPLWNSSMLMSRCPSMPDCFFGAEAAKHIDTPFLVHSEQFDAFQLGWYVGHGPPWNDTESAFAHTLADGVRQTLTDLSPSSSANRAFSTACYDHCTSASPAYFNYKVGGSSSWNIRSLLHSGSEAVSFADATRMFVEDQMASSAIEQCDDVNCSTGCA